MLRIDCLRATDHVPTGSVTQRSNNGHLFNIGLAPPVSSTQWNGAAAQCTEISPLLAYSARAKASLWGRSQTAQYHTPQITVSCQETRPVPTAAPLTVWMWPEKPLHRVHAEFANKEGHDFLFMVDAHSKWPQILPMLSTTAATTIAAFRHMFARFGFPVNVVTDNGPQIISAEFGKFLRQNVVKHVRVAPYHPASNGAAERMVQPFKQSVEVSVSTRASMSHRLADFLLTYRTTPHAVTERTASNLLLARECRTRLSLLRPTVEESVLKRQAEQADKRLGPFAEFYVGEAVSVRDIGAEAWQTVWLMVVWGDVMSIIYVALRRGRSRRKCTPARVSRQQTRRRVSRLFSHQPEEREAVQVEETCKVESSAAHSQSNLQSNEVSAPEEEPVLRRSSRTTQKPPRLIEEM